MASTPDFTNEEKYKCADREVELRGKVYPKLIRKGEMTIEKADREIDIMRAIAMDYYRAHLREAKGISKPIGGSVS